MDILHFPWFHRTWPIQELVLEREAVIVSGSKYLWWSSFVEALRILQEVHEHHQIAGLDGNSLSSPASFYYETDCYRLLENLLRPDSHRGSAVSTALRVVRQKLSSDSRDKVYGLYGIFQYLRISGLPQVDYRQTVQQIYTDITQAAIRDERSLTILYQVCLPSLIPSLPSWVPDWSNSAYILPIYSDRCFASDSREPQYSFNGTNLTVSGVLIDELCDLAISTSSCTPNFRRGYNARVNMKNIDERYAAVIELVRTLQAWVRSSTRLDTYPTGETPLEAFYRTVTQSAGFGDDKDWTPTAFAYTTFSKWISIVTANFPNNYVDLETLHRDVQTRAAYEPIKSDYIDLFGGSANVEEWVDDLKIRLFLRVYNPQVARLQHDIALNTYHRTFFTTRDGYMGIGPRWSELGDHFALIAGLRTPFIVRRTGPNYRLIGPAYIHGVMRGERWDDSRIEDITLV